MATYGTSGDDKQRKRKILRDLHAGVKKDIAAIGDWRSKTERLIRDRLGERKKNTMYPGAPNFVEPIIDDNIRAKVAQEMSVMFSSRQLANFIPLSAEASEAQRHAEVGFDAMLRLMLDFRSSMEHALETKMERGFSVIKVVENATEYKRIMGPKIERQMVVDEMGAQVEVVVELPAPVIPDIEVVDPFDFVVPCTTQKLQKAERITQIHRYSVREFKDLAEQNEWKNVDRVLGIVDPDGDGEERGDFGDAGPTNANGKKGSGFRPHIGLQEVTDGTKPVEVWECYHYFDGEPHRTILYPGDMDSESGNHGIELECIPWIWADTGERREWPYVQLRSENRRREFYDTRSDAELLIDNQKAATAYMNGKGVQLDFYSKPMLSGPRGSMEGIKWIPGEVLPENVQPVAMPRIDSIFDFSADTERGKAAKRSGAAQGSFGDTRMGGDKTATQVNAEAMTAQRLTNVSVLRDGEPMAALYQMMWDYLRHNPVELPMVNESRQFQGQISLEIFKLPFRVESAASAQQANPDFVLQQLMSLGQFLQANPYVRQYEFAKILVDQVNPQITNRLVFDPSQPGNGTMPLEQQVAQMAQEGQQVAAQVDNITKYVGELAQQDLEAGEEESGMVGGGIA